MNFKYFSDGHIILHTPRHLFAEFFDRFAHLYPHKDYLPNPAPDNDGYPQSLPTCLGRKELPAPLIQAMLAIESAADAVAPPNGDPIPHFESALRSWLAQNSRTTEHESASPPPAFQQPQSNGQHPEPLSRSTEHESRSAETPPPVAVAPPDSNGHHPEPLSRDTEHESPDAQSQIKNQNSKIDPPLTDFVLPPGWATRVEPWPEPVDANLLLNEIRATFARFAVLPKFAPETLALYVLHTYAFELRDVCTYVGVESPVRRCGKTTLLTLLCHLVNRPVVAANVSSPSFYRAIQDLRPTLMIDEADKFLKGKHDLQGILHAGYSRRTAYVLRAVPAPSRRRRPRHNQSPSAPASSAQQSSIPVSGSTPHSASAPTHALSHFPTFDSGHSPTFDSPPSTACSDSLAFFSVWCPKIIAQIGHLPDILADRCIIFRMQRKTPTEKCERLRDLDLTPLRQQCARFVQDHSLAIAKARPDLPTALNDRAADIWEPLFTLADLAGGDWPKLARDAALALSGAGQDNNAVGALLLDILLLFVARNNPDRIFSRDLLAGLESFPQRPWAELLKGKQLTELWLAAQLRPFGVRPRTIWINGASAKGYLFDDFKEIWPRYVSQSEFNARAAELKPSTPPPSPPPTPG